ncbi:MAG: ornithine cyclodeaminase family protein [Bacteroidetes bacterium]|nr:ornithine cyclodeaminase family protein [Bacteroidota bacterium]MDA0874131.1 ornithine cyclodeaminase family protein [Bacteroidota bacterium]
MPAVLDGDTLLRLLESTLLIEALRQGFRETRSQPPRVHLPLQGVGVNDATLLLMPAWNEAYTGVKTATIHPSNGLIGLPSVHASYLLKETATGRDLAVLDGTVLTRLRTAAASALASDYLSRADARTLLMVGAGSLAPHLIRAHAAVRPLERVLIWNRSQEAAHRVGLLIDMPVEIVADLEATIPQADIICCATLSTAALIRGHLVRPGTHVDLVGAYRPDMRECDSALIERAEVYVDTYEGARHEAGDLILAAAETGWSLDMVRSDLAGLASGRAPGRTRPEALTLFKSVGASLEDLIAAGLAWERFQAGHGA